MIVLDIFKVHLMTCLNKHLMLFLWGAEEVMTCIWPEREGMREGGNRKSKMLNANCPPQAIRTGERCGEMGSVMSLLRSDYSRGLWSWGLHIFSKIWDIFIMLYLLIFNLGNWYFKLCVGQEKYSSSMGHLCSLPVMCDAVDGAP